MPATDPAVPALAAQVADLRSLVSTLKTRVEAAGMVGGGVRLHERVAELEQAIAALGEDPGPAPKVAAPNWAALDGPERAVQLSALADWVDGYLMENYPHAGLRPCWADHPAAVWELSTLRAEWTRVYEQKSPELAGALTWHDRWLPGVIARVTVVQQDCGGGCSLARRQPQSRSQRPAR